MGNRFVATAVTWLLENVKASALTGEAADTLSALLEDVRNKALREAAGACDELHAVLTPAGQTVASSCAELIREKVSK